VKRVQTEHCPKAKLSWLSRPRRSQEEDSTPENIFAGPNSALDVGNGYRVYFHTSSKIMAR